MSSGKLTRNYLNNAEKDFRFNESAIITNYSLQKSNYSENLSFYDNLVKDNKNTLQQINENVKENHLNMIKEIHQILKSSENLTMLQKFSFCASQRFFMKLYLKRICKEV